MEIHLYLTLYSLYYESKLLIDTQRGVVMDPVSEKTVNKREILNKQKATDKVKKKLDSNLAANNLQITLKLPSNDLKCCKLPSNYL